MDWTHFIPPMLTAFLASLVECIEALTVILAVGAVLGWRGALIGTGFALCCLLVVVAILGPALTLIPLKAIHLGIGMLLLVFGLRWLRKAVLRAAGVIPMRDELAVYVRQSSRFHALSAGRDGRSRMGLVTAFQITMVEGIEVVFVVLAIGAADRSLLLPASLGAFVALVLVSALGVALHRPIARIPENSLKFTVGVLACSFGIFWMGEAIGVKWPGEDWSVLALATGILAAAFIVVRLKARRSFHASHES
jgi:uncharacterized membrane protein